RREVSLLVRGGSWHPRAPSVTSSSALGSPGHAGQPASANHGLRTTDHGQVKSAAAAQAADGPTGEAPGIEAEPAPDEAGGAGAPDDPARSEVLHLAPVDQQRFKPGHAVGDAGANDDPLGGDREGPPAQLGQEGGL